VLDDLAVVPMGGDDLDERVFATLDPILDHGQDLWWLYLSLCHGCRQHWLVAQESRIYDIFFLKRVAPETAEAIIESGKWPDDFSTYERVLTLGRTLCTPPRFLDPFAYSLQWTIEDLRKERPGITPREIAYLLGISQVNAWILFWKVRLLGASNLPG
jgi:hypothetical protein